MPTKKPYTREDHQRFIEKCLNKWKQEDIRSVLEDRRNGLTYKQIGKKWDRTPQRIAQLVKKYSKTHGILKNVVPKNLLPKSLI